MRIFIDESGDFGWVPPQISLHCAVIAPNSGLPDLFRRHFEWKKSLVGQHRRREIKASSVTDAALDNFVRSVILPDSDTKLTVVGIDTRLVSKSTLEEWRDQLSRIAIGASEWSHSRSFPVAERQYNELSGWIWNRSAENLAAMLSLAYVIDAAFQNAIVHFNESVYDQEFEDVEIVIDRSFILSELKRERDRFNQAISALEGRTTRSSANGRRVRRPMSAAARARISKAMKARWAAGKMGKRKKTA